MDRTATSFVPRYYAIEQALRTRLALLRPGDLLPSDAELCAEFGVSRMTARNAMQRLAQEGLVHRIPGRGTFVAEPPLHRQADSLLSFSTEMQRLGRTPSSRVLERVVRGATDEEREQMALRPGEDVVALRRIRLADGLPIAVEATALRVDCAPVVMAADLERESLHAALVAAGKVLANGRAKIWAAAATPQDAEALGVAPGSTLLVERRTILDGNGVPIERTESRYPADRYALEVGFEVASDGAGPPGGRS
jgi:GntR family transcriptional regulator